MSIVGYDNGGSNTADHDTIVPVHALDQFGNIDHATSAPLVTLTVTDSNAIVMSPVESLNIVNGVGSARFIITQKGVYTATIGGSTTLAGVGNSKNINLQPGTYFTRLPLLAGSMLVV